MKQYFGMEPTTAALKEISVLIRGLVFAVEDINIESDSLRLVSNSLLDRANELESLIRDALDRRIAEREEHQAALVAVRAERDLSGSPGDVEQAEAPGDFLATWVKIAGWQAEERSGASTVPIVVMAANLREASA
jgi:hypothetical protein